MRSVAALLTLAALAGGTGCIASAAEQPASSAASADETGAAEREARQVAAVVDPLIRADIAASGIPGAAFVFVSDGRIVYQQGYGVSDVASRTAVDPETTVWPIASITKVITAIAALQLVDQQRIDLDADLNRYLKRVRVPAQGRYISSIACRSCAGSGEDAFQVEVNADGTLTLWGQTWLPLGDDLFVRDDGKRTLGFARNATGKVISVTGGSWRAADRLQ